uniref:Uncharacterized protein n=1 Tax=Macrostomum lignano TaxID=282301 RepID=A0A1I8F632_9PLAT
VVPRWLQATRQTRQAQAGYRKASKTSEYYAVQNIPDRFDNPDCLKGTATLNRSLESAACYRNHSMNTGKDRKLI